ncbi:MAG: TIGR00159 family protein [Ruminococcaceae bacterium]|nr:TIGR00159 family protein [Oscillospiraceae bacterium]
MKTFSFGLIDAVDIFLVAVLFYYLFKFFRDKRAGKLAIGVVLLVIFQIVSNVLNMKATHFIMENVFQVGLIAILIVFQPELRKVLEKVGGDSLRGIKSIGEQKTSQQMQNMINGICESVCDMAKDKTGALIVLERETGLGDIIESGTVVNADVSPFLIRNIFFKNSPLHDGAMVIRGTRLFAAGCFLPLSDESDIVKDLGTRHRAAIGMSETSDALVIVVSEETGTISTAFRGELKRNYDYASLKAELENKLEAEPKNNSIRRNLFKRIGKKGRNETEEGKDGE